GDILLQQGCAETRQFRPQVQRALQIRGTQRIALDADEMQARSCRGLSFEKLPGAEKVQPGAETGLADAQLSIRRQRGEAFAQRVVLKEYVAGFVETAGSGEIDVAKGAGKRLTLLVPVEA